MKSGIAAADFAPLPDAPTATNKTNEITKQLTLFASIFMPLSFVVGFFGQNFPILGEPAYFWASLGVIVVLPIAMVGYFFKRGWL